MALGEERGAQRAGGDAVYQQRPGAAGLLDVVGGGSAVVGAVGDVAELVAVFGGAAVALHVDSPGVVDLPRDPVHRRAERPPLALAVEARRRQTRTASRRYRVLQHA